MNRITATLAVAVLVTGESVSPVGAHIVPDSWTNAETVVRNPLNQGYITDLRYAKHTGFDRVVVDMTGKPPGYDVRYVSSLNYCGTGNPVTGLASGRKFLKIQLTPARGHNDAGENTYKGPVNRYIGLPTVKRIVKLCDYEGYVEWGLVLDRKAGFHTNTLYGPSRIYVDIRH
jgi:hypothetical protein